MFDERNKTIREIAVFDCYGAGENSLLSEERNADQLLPRINMGLDGMLAVRGFDSCVCLCNVILGSINRLDGGGKGRR